MFNRQTVFQMINLEKSALVIKRIKKGCRLSTMWIRFTSQYSIAKLQLIKLNFFSLLSVLLQNVD